MKFSIKDFFSKCDQIQNDQIFCAVIIKTIMSRYDLMESIMSFVITLQKKIRLWYFCSFTSNTEALFSLYGELSWISLRDNTERLHFSCELWKTFQSTRSMEYHQATASQKYYVNHFKLFSIVNFADDRNLILLAKCWFNWSCF